MNKYPTAPLIIRCANRPSNVSIQVPQQPVLDEFISAQCAQLDIYIYIYIYKGTRDMLGENSAPHDSFKVALPDESSIKYSPIPEYG